MAEAQDKEIDETVLTEQNGIKSKGEGKTHILYPTIFNICFFIGSIVLIIFRISINLLELPELIEISKDVDFLILYEGFWQNGLINFYNQISLPDYLPNWPPYYLYHWYFFFLPVAIFPYEIGVYLWDALRLLTCLYISITTPKIIKNKLDGMLFLVCVLIGYFIDAWFNNINFLILLFLFISYLTLEKGQIWVSGIFFCFSLFKINSILYLAVLLLTRKITKRNIIKFVIPTIILIIPYIFFPTYFLSMINNWGFSDSRIQGLIYVDSITWKALQPSHLMFLSFCIIVFVANLKNYKTRNYFRALTFGLLAFYYIYLYITAFFIPYGFI